MHTRWALAFCVLALVSLGLVALSSASLSFEVGKYNYFSKQCVWLLLAFVVTLVTAKLPLEWARRYRFWFFGGCIFLLILVLIPGIGIKVNGARRWLSLPGFRFQVSDLAKPGLIFFLADYLDTYRRQIETLKLGFLIPVSAIGLTCLLVIAEPDFGTTFLCGVVGFGMLFLAGARLRYLFPTIATGVVLFGIAVYLDPVRFKRLTSFLDVQNNRLDGAYQLWNGMLGFVAGGLGGVGLGQGRQQLAFLPEAHTDFIFPVMGEELGFIFTLGTVGLFVGLFSLAFWNMRRIGDYFQYFLCGGIVLCITVQALMNMGVVMGLLPTKGISLPFISYGGSNLIVMGIFVGILFNCFKREGREIAVTPSEFM